MSTYTFTPFDELGAEEPVLPGALRAADCACGAGFALDDVRPAPDERSLDLRHVGRPADPAPFALTPAALDALCTANAFAVPNAGRVLFGLRGCSPVTPPDGEWREAVDLAEGVPDHVELRCTLGVWDRDAGRICVFRGSTVPNRVYVWAQACGCRKANVLLTGLHRYVIGRHSSLLGAFRVPPGTRLAVARSRTDLVLDTADPILDDDPPDNIHCSYFRSDEGVRFSSAGCQTVWGSFDAGALRHVDPPTERGWATFRTRAGLLTTDYPAGAAADPQDGTVFRYVLLTGREARLAADGAALRRLRYGSTGDTVVAVQRALGIGADGHFGAKTADALSGWQRRERGWADAIWCPGDLGVA